MHEVRRRLQGEQAPEILAAKAGDEKPKSATLSGIAIRREESRRTNQRREDRYFKYANSAQLRFRRKRAQVTLVNLSSHGAMVRGDAELRVGERIDFQVDDCAPIRAQVRWVRGGDVGLEFLSEMLVFAPADGHSLAVSGRRAGEQPPRIAVRGDREPRQHLLWAGTFYFQNETRPVRIYNISPNGASIVCDEELLAGTACVLEFAGGGANAVQGRVRWCRDGQIGIQFEQPYDLRALAEIGSGTVAPSEMPQYLKPDYLTTEGAASSPWFARQQGLSADDL